MNWWNQLDKNRGSRPRSVLVTSGSSAEVAARLTAVISYPEVVIHAHDNWMPYGKPKLGPDAHWDCTPTLEAKLDKSDRLLSLEYQQEVRQWWLEVPHNANTPNWDIASTCTVGGRPGLLLIEAKAHAAELSAAGKTLPSTLNGWKNHVRIGRAIADAAAEFQIVTKKPWAIFRDSNYQLSNRFAWAWKLTSLGIPVVLVYLGFLNAADMKGNGALFSSEDDWTSIMKDHGKGIVPESVWNSTIEFDGVPFLPLLRVFDQPFDLTR